MKLKEAPDQVKIEVTQRDITKGIQGDMDKCAIALAAKRIMGDNPSVDEGGMYIKIGKSKFFYSFPKKADTFINKFDDDKTSVKPFDFVTKLDYLVD